MYQNGSTTSAIRTFLFVEAVAFSIAALIHSGVLLQGYEHREASIAETVIALVLFAGLVVTVISPASTRAAGLGAQGFALLGTCVGVFTIAIGIGPRTLPDILYHITIVVVLVCGLVVCRSRRPLFDV